MVVGVVVLYYRKEKNW